MRKSTAKARVKQTFLICKKQLLALELDRREMQKKLQEYRAKVETELKLEWQARFDQMQARAERDYDKNAARLEEKLRKAHEEQVQRGGLALRVEKVLRDRMEKAESRCIVLQSSLAGAIKELEAEREAGRKQREAYEAELKALRESFQIARDGDRTMLNAHRESDAKRESELKRERGLRQELETSCEYYSAGAGLSTFPVIATDSVPTVRAANEKILAARRALLTMKKSKTEAEGRHSLHVYVDL